jgi:hypothetical protein
VHYILCEVDKGSADAAGGVQYEFKGHKSRPMRVERD